MGAGDYFACAIKTSGTLACWGHNPYGQATPPAGTFTAVTPAMSTPAPSGPTAPWTAGATTPTARPVRRTGTFTSVTAGEVHACALKTNGTLACWGDNSYGQASPPSGTFVAVSAGAYLTCAIKTDGTLACWGEDFDGQTTPPSGTFTAVSAGGYHTCAIKTSDSIACWGANDLPARLSAPSGSFGGARLPTVSAGGYHTCAIRTDGTLACWGYNTYGQASPPAGTLHRRERRRLATPAP